MKQEVRSLELDVHSQSIVVALSEGSGGETRHRGAISSDP